MHTNDGDSETKVQSTRNIVYSRVPKNLLDMTDRANKNLNTINKIPHISANIKRKFPQLVLKYTETINFTATDP